MRERESGCERSVTLGLGRPMRCCSGLEKVAESGLIVGLG
jgi:hypothetical protein